MRFVMAADEADIGATRADVLFFPVANESRRLLVRPFSRMHFFASLSSLVTRCIGLGAPTMMRCST